MEMNRGNFLYYLVPCTKEGEAGVGKTLFCSPEEKNVLGMTFEELHPHSEKDLAVVRIVVIDLGKVSPK